MNFDFQTGAKENQILSGFTVEVMLKEKLWSSGSNIVGMPISDIRTTVCQNKCSGHGVCNSDTRACMCDTFWMPNLYYFWGIGEANCGMNESNLTHHNHNQISNLLLFIITFPTDWSILYVVIGVFIIFILISAICWALTYYCRTTKPRMRAKAQKYALLDSQDNEVPSRKFFLFTIGKNVRKKDLKKHLKKNHQFSFICSKSYGFDVGIGHRFRCTV